MTESCCRRDQRSGAALGGHRRDRRHSLGPRSGARCRSAGMSGECQFGPTDGVSGNSPVNRTRFATSSADRLRILKRYKRIAMVGLSANVPAEPFRGDLSDRGRLRRVPGESTGKEILGRSVVRFTARGPGACRGRGYFPRARGGAGSSWKTPSRSAPRWSGCSLA